MSFNKRIVPDFDSLVKIREEVGNDQEFIKRVVGNSDCLMGDSRSISLIREIEESLQG